MVATSGEELLDGFHRDQTATAHPDRPDNTGLKQSIDRRLADAQHSGGFQGPVGDPFIVPLGRSEFGTAPGWRAYGVCASPSPLSAAIGVGPLELPESSSAHQPDSEISSFRSWFSAFWYASR